MQTYGKLQDQTTCDIPTNKCHKYVLPLICPRTYNLHTTIMKLRISAAGINIFLQYKSQPGNDIFLPRWKEGISINPDFCMIGKAKRRAPHGRKQAQKRRRHPAACPGEHGAQCRTTFAPELSTEDILGAAMLVQGAQRYFLQQYRPRKDEDLPAHPPSYVQETAARVREAIGVCEVRGL